MHSCDQEGVARLQLASLLEDIYSQIQQYVRHKTVATAWCCAVCIGKLNSIMIMLNYTAVDPPTHYTPCRQAHIET